MSEIPASEKSVGDCNIIFVNGLHCRGAWFACRRWSCVLKQSTCVLQCPTKGTSFCSAFSASHTSHAPTPQKYLCHPSFLVENIWQLKSLLSFKAPWIHTFSKYQRRQHVCIHVCIKQHGDTMVASLTAVPGFTF